MEKESYETIFFREKKFCSLKITDYKIRRQQQEAFYLCRQSEFPLKWSRMNVVFTRTYVTTACTPAGGRLEDKNKNCKKSVQVNPLKPELNSICHLLALLGAHHFLHVSRIRVKLLTFRLLMSYIYGAPIIDVSRSHTTTQHSR